MSTTRANAQYRPAPLFSGTRRNAKRLVPWLQGQLKGHFQRRGEAILLLLPVNCIEFPMVRLNDPMVPRRAQSVAGIAAAPAIENQRHHATDGMPAGSYEISS
jgi:hypothetical protein